MLSSTIRSFHAWLVPAVAFVALTPHCLPAEEEEEATPSIAIALPRVALDGVTLQQARFEVLNADGVVDKSANGPIAIEGLRFEPEDAFSFELKNGVLELNSDLARGHRIFADGSAVTARYGELEKSEPVRVIPGWLSLVPPVIAIVLAISIRNVYVALLMAIYAGVVVLEVNPWDSFLRLVDTYLLNEFVELPGGGDHIRIILFTLFLGATIGVMSASGGTLALVNRLTRYATTRERGQFMTWLLGLVVFFDDYANTLLVGSTMRSVSDRLRISRQKLAFLVDATAAPVAGIAIVSTWVGFEISQIESGMEAVGVEVDDLYSLFLQTIPFRFYPILILLFVVAIALSGRDFGPMRKAEEEFMREASGGGESVPEDEPLPDTMLIRNAVVPLLTLLVGIGVGMSLKSDESVWVLLVSSFGASLVAVVMAFATRALPLHTAVDSWISGARGMFVGVTVLVLAWSIATLCDSDHLGTAAYIVAMVGQQLRPEFLPLIAFLIAAAVSFATGSSFATMGLLIPLFISITHYMLQMTPGEFVASNIFLGTVGAVLAGAIFGDHCSPISDTTVLSSLATDCDHLEHVSTQMPYAVSVGVVSAVCGYLPVGFGWSPWIGLAAGSVVTVLLVLVLGRKPDAVPQ